MPQTASWTTSIADDEYCERLMQFRRDNWMRTMTLAKPGSTYRPKRFSCTRCELAGVSMVLVRWTGRQALARLAGSA